MTIYGEQMNEYHQQLSSGAIGLECTAVELYAPGSWSFNFDNKLNLNVQSPWRILKDKGIALANEDDGQQFGLPAPVIAAELALKLLSKEKIEQILIKEFTADITLKFESRCLLEIFNNSSGYERWSCGLSSGLQVIGMGGGSTSIVGHKSAK